VEAGAYPSCHWARAPGTGRRGRWDETILTLTPGLNLESPINPTCIFLGGRRRPEYQETHTHAQGENANSTQKGPCRDSNQEPSCEATVLTIKSPCSPAQFILYRIIWRNTIVAFTDALIWRPGWNSCFLLLSVLSQKKQRSRIEPARVCRRHTAYRLWKSLGWFCYAAARRLSLAGLDWSQISETHCGIRQDYYEKIGGLCVWETEHACVCVCVRALTSF